MKALLVIGALAVVPATWGAWKYASSSCCDCGQCESGCSAGACTCSECGCTCGSGCCQPSATAQPTSGGSCSAGSCCKG